jgi:hypothetical protein
MNKICIILFAGLCNQLFMIFTAISKALDENKDFSIYPINDNKYKYYFTTFLKSLIFKVEDNLDFIKNQPAYEELEFHYSPIPVNANVLKGYFQSPKYFHHNKDKIIRILKIDEFQEKYKLDYKTIALHLRFGDGSYNQSHHYLLRPSYYINALNKMIEIIPNIDEYKILIFSESNDDLLVNDYISEIKEKVNLNYNKFYELKPGLKDYEELLYMSNCDHLITANSTFSWFAAYLCNNKNKKVIYPKEWFGPVNKNKSTKDLFFDDWIMTE